MRRFLAAWAGEILLAAGEQVCRSGRHRWGVEELLDAGGSMLLPGCLLVRFTRRCGRCGRWTVSRTDQFPPLTTPTQGDRHGHR